MAGLIRRQKKAPQCETFSKASSLTGRKDQLKRFERSLVMKRRLIGLTVISAALCLALAGAAAAQDFQKSYRLGAGGLISIGTVSGDVSVTGYDGGEVVVKAVKQGRDSDRVEIEDFSASGRINIKVRYPENCECDASVRFDVQVPRSVNYNFDHIASVSGDVAVSGVTGRVRVSSVSGDVRVKNVSGAVSATAVSGDVEVEIVQLDGTEDMKFSSVSGDVSVRLPAGLEADVDMSSFSGAIDTNFPIEVRSERHGPRRWARGQVGEGASRRLKISSLSGDLSLKHP
jgi:Putative adhesin